MKDDLLIKFQSGKFKEVVSSWNRIEPVSDGNKDDRILIAFSLYTLGQIEDCESICGDLLPYCESRADFFALYGSVLRRNGKTKDSEQIYKKGLSLFPDDSAIANNFANLLIDQGSLKEAKDILVSLKTSNPSNITDIEANLQRINILSENASQSKDLPVGIFSAAFSEELKTLNDAPEDSNKAKDIKEELQLVDNDKVIEVDEMIRLARLMINNNPKLALNDCQLIHEKLTVPTAELYELAGDALIRLSAFADAEICYLKAVSLSAGSLACFTNLATLAQMRGDKPLAIDYLAKAMSLDGTGAHNQHHGDLKTKILSMKKGKTSPFEIKSLLDVTNSLQKV